MNDFVETTTSYAVALGVMIASNSEGILTYGGLLLLVIRLIADAPRAWANIRRLWRDN